MKTKFTIINACTRARVLFIIAILLTVINTNAQVYTPRGSIVWVSTSGLSDWTAQQAARAWVLNAYPNVDTLAPIDGTTGQYNCYAYAFHVSEGGNKVWMNNPDSFTIDGSYTLGSLRCNTKVYYTPQADHAALGTDNPGIFISKWGNSFLVRHAIDYGPYDATDAEYYNRNYDTIFGPATFCDATSDTFKLADSRSPVPPATFLWEGILSGRVTPTPDNTFQTRLVKNFDDFVNVKATISYNSLPGNTCTPTPVSITRYTIRAGFPYYSALGSGPSGNSTVLPYSYYHYTMSYPGDFPGASFAWTVPSGWTIISGDGTDHIYVQTGSLSSSGAVEVDITACGLTRLTHKYVEVGYGGGGDEPDAVSPRPEMVNKITPLAEGGTTGKMLQVTPNPARDFVVVTLAKKRAPTVGFTPSIREVRIIGNAGSVAKTVSFNNKQISQRISVAGIASGMYVVSVYDGRVWYNEKLFIAK